MFIVVFQELSPGCGYTDDFYAIEFVEVFQTLELATAASLAWENDPDRSNDRLAPIFRDGVPSDAEFRKQVLEVKHHLVEN
jgi:hypothetical protein